METKENGLQRSIGRIEGKMDLLLDRFSGHMDDDAVAFDSVYKRLSRVEYKISWMTGVFAVIATVWTYLVYGVKPS